MNIMKKKEQNFTRNYVPTKFSDNLEKLHKKYIYKYGKLNYVIFAKWPQIVGKFFADYTKPEKITSIPQSGDNIKKILYVKVASSVAIEFQHLKNKIIEKINAFLGYRAIHDIKIYQNLGKINTESNENNLNNNKEDLEKIKSKIKHTIQKINDKHLEESLLNLGTSISSNEKRRKK